MEIRFVSNKELKIVYHVGNESNFPDLILDLVSQHQTMALQFVSRHSQARIIVALASFTFELSSITVITPTKVFGIIVYEGYLLARGDRIRLELYGPLTPANHEVDF